MAEQKDIYINVEITLKTGEIVTVEAAKWRVRELVGYAMEQQNTKSINILMDSQHEWQNTPDHPLSILEYHRIFSMMKLEREKENKGWTRD